MALQSHSNISDELASVSPDCSSETTPTEVYSSPLGINGGISGLYLSNEELNPINLLGDAVADRAPRNIVLNSEGTRIGDDVYVTVQGPANFTVNHVGPGCQPLENGAQKDDKVKVQKSGEKIRCRFRYIFLPSTVVFLLLLLAISLAVFRKTIFTKAIVFPPINPDPHNNISGHPLYARANWGALDQKEEPPLMPVPASVVIISHTDSDGCADFASCANRTQMVQYGFLKDGHRDIGYNFLIGGESGIYIGRGWNRQNSIRINSLAIAFIGDFNREMINARSEDAAQDLIDVGVKTGIVSADYKLIGENQTCPSRFSPGWNLAKAIQRWKNYFPGTMF